MLQKCEKKEIRFEKEFDQNNRIIFVGPQYWCTNEEKLINQDNKAKVRALLHNFANDKLGSLGFRHCAYFHR